MPVHPKTQAALNAAHAALDQVRHAARQISDTADQSATIDALEAITDSIGEVPIPVPPEPDTETSAKKGKKTTKKRR